MRLWSALRATNSVRAFKRLLPASVLDCARFFYSPAFRAARREARRNALALEALSPLYDALDGRVHGGPFCGMCYVRNSVGSALPPKLLGTYEMELHGVLNGVLRHDYRGIVDIGAAEGYYAVGLALKLPLAQVIAFEATREGCDLLRDLAAKNGALGRVNIRGNCAPTDLADALEARRDATLVICDVEGAEFSLMDPDAVPRLRACDLLVELHPWVFPDIKDSLIGRFSCSHEIQVIRARPRHRADFPPEIGVQLSLRTKLALLDEGRPTGMEWLWMRAAPTQVA